MEYLYSVVDYNSKVLMIMNVINTNAPDDCKASILVSPEMQGCFDISVRYFLDFIIMNPFLNNNVTAKVFSVTRSGGGMGGGSRIDHGSGMPYESDGKASMGVIKNKYFRGSERGHVPTLQYNTMSKAQQQAVYCLCDKLDSIITPAAGSVTSKEYDNLKRQVSAFSNKVDYLLTVEDTSGDEVGDKKKEAKLGGNK